MSDRNIFLLMKALFFASVKHQSHKRNDRNRSPYLNHPVSVAYYLSSCGITDPDILCAALLHDTLEKTETTREELLREFGQKILSIVEELTDDPALSKKEQHEAQIRNAPLESHEAKIIKIGDKISNITHLKENSPLDLDSKKKLEYLNWTRQVIDGIRGTNTCLENRYDEQYEKTRKILEGNNE
jgi:guanosine-3',5'-bis(diphosphate) 3'-pyrophosphohydrolase